MKRYLFIFSDSCDYVCWSSRSFEGAPHIEEAKFRKGTSDWEIMEAARAMELEKEHRDYNCAGECFFTRKLLRIVEIAREIELDCSGGL
jgi:hypothetical protein